jgi:hypothetical protein
MAIAIASFALLSIPRSSWVTTGVSGRRSRSVRQSLAEHGVECGVLGASAGVDDVVVAT